MNKNHDDDHVQVAKQMNHRHYVGGNWNVIGKLQFDFMKTVGLTPDTVFLDIACGSLRGGVHFVNYLNPHKYLGIEYSPTMVFEGIDKELTRKTYLQKHPYFVVNGDFRFDLFDKTYSGPKPTLSLAQSLFTHLTDEDIVKCLQGLENWLGNAHHDAYITFNNQKGQPKHKESHPIKVWCKAWEDMEKLIKDNSGWDAELIGEWGHPSGQQMMYLSR